MELISKGAEADILLKESRGRKVVIKKRVPKRYRVRKLDVMLRKSRNRHEIKLMEKAMQAGVTVPKIVGKSTFFFEMEYVEGKKLKDVLNENNCERYAKELGRMVAGLHNAGIIHGDITTSNVIVEEKSKELVLIDFGLGFFSTSAEDMATDIHVLEETTYATHPDLAARFMSAFFENYFEVLESRKKEEVKKRLEMIRKRGRYVRKRAE